MINDLDLKKYDNEILFLPLGGCNEIGMNLNAYYHKGKWLLVDMGIGFSEGNFPGMDILFPLPKFLEEQKDNILGLLLTHAHEDHIGAIPYIWERVGCPIYTTRFTQVVLQSKLSEFESEYEIEMHTVTPNKKVNLGPFSAEFISITHSIPDMHGIMIRTKAGNIFHTGDWKLDPEPIVGDFTDEKRLHEIAKEGILAVVGDSTNIFNPGVSGSEGALGRNLNKLVKEYGQKMVVITTFSSNIARLHSIAKAAEDNGRQVIMAGRSLWRLYNAARECGFLEDCHEFLPPQAIKKFPREKVLVLCTGCQGEELAAVNKMSKHSHPDIKLTKGDTIFFSSKIIPGNEKRIYNLFNSFCQMGVEVLTERDHFVHVSGHPSRDEVKRLYEILKPQMVVPVHGEPMHLHEHCNFAKSLGIKNTIELKNGEIAVLRENGAEVIGCVESGYLVLDGNMIIDEFSPIIRDRKSMRDNGLVVVFLILNKNGRLIRQPKLLLPGIIDIKEDAQFLDFLIEEVRECVENNSKGGDKAISKAVSSLMRKLIRDYRGKFPYVMMNIEHISV